MIIGDSTGALALCNEYVVLAKNGTDRMAVENGLGVCDFGVSVHYQSAQDPQLENLSKERSIFAIPDGAAIRSDRCSLILLGKVELFMDGRKL